MIHLVSTADGSSGGTDTGAQDDRDPPVDVVDGLTEKEMRLDVRSCGLISPTNRTASFSGGWAYPRKAYGECGRERYSQE